MKLQIDKVKHFAILLAFTVAGLTAGDVLSVNLLFTLCLVFAASVAVIWGKEEYDKKHPPHVKDGWDAFAGSLGNYAGVLAFGVLKHLGAVDALKALILT